MQLFALTDQQEIIEAEHAERKKDYACMECNGPVRVRQGEFRRSHFYHFRETPGCRQATKSLEHIQTQIFLKAFLKGEIILEKRFPTVNRIADVVWEEEKVIFEVQCSPILAQEVMERNRDYAACGYRVIWILHDLRYGGRRMTSAEHFLQRSPHYYTNMDKEGVGIIYDRLWGRPVDKNPIESMLVPVRRAAKVPDLLKMRASTWTIRMKGDFFDTLKVQEVKKRKTLRQVFKKYYAILLQTALETASR